MRHRKPLYVTLPLAGLVISMSRLLRLHWSDFTSDVAVAAGRGFGRLAQMLMTHTERLYTAVILLRFDLLTYLPRILREGQADCATSRRVVVGSCGVSLTSETPRPNYCLSQHQPSTVSFFLSLSVCLYLPLSSSLSHKTALYTGVTDGRTEELYKNHTLQ